METTNVRLYIDGKCNAVEFIEEDRLCLNNDGTVHYIQFIEDTSIKFVPNAFYAAEFIEQFIVYLTDESDVLLTDESGNYLTAMI